jgi:hypothetical protein
MVQQPASTSLKTLRDLVMNMDSRIRFAGILDKEGRLLEGGMRNSVVPLLAHGKDDLFYLRTVSRIRDLKKFRSNLGELEYIYIKMEKLSFVSLSLRDEKTLLVSMEPDTDPSFIVPAIKNVLVE